MSRGFETFVAKFLHFNLRLNFMFIFLIFTFHFSSLLFFTKCCVVQSPPSIFHLRHAPSTSRKGFIFRHRLHCTSIYFVLLWLW